MRQIARTDKNQQFIINALRKVGCFVRPCHQVGDGFPDLFVAYHHVFILLECKTEKGKLTPEQVIFHRQCKGPIFTVTSPQEAIQVVFAVVRDKLNSARAC